MKRLALLGLIVYFAVGCTPQPEGISPSTPSTPATPQSPQNSPSPEAENRYQSSRFGFGFQHPNGFTVDDRQLNQSTDSEKFLLERLEVWKSEDYKAIATGTWKGGEYPASVTISIFDNSEKRPLSAWKDGSLSQGADQTTTVAGQEALAYASTGLYEADNVIFTSPDGRYVIHIRGAYINPDDPMRQAFQQVVSSFQFGVYSSLK